MRLLLVLVPISALVACAARTPPEFAIDLPAAGTPQISGRVDSEGDKRAMTLAAGNAVARLGWGAKIHIDVAPRTDSAAWEARIGDVILAIGSLTTGHLSVSGRAVEVTGEAPASAIPGMAPNLASIFGDSYHVHVAVQPPTAAPALAKAAQPAPAFTVPASGTIRDRWSIEVFGQTRRSTLIELSADGPTTFQPVPAVTCEAGPVIVEPATDAAGRPAERTSRELSCRGAVLEMLTPASGLGDSSFGCVVPVNASFAVRAMRFCPKQFLLKAETGATATILATLRAEVH